MTGNPTPSHSNSNANGSAVVINKMIQTKQQRLYQLNQLDLNLETTPRDSRYSNNLMELMKKEEVLLKDPSSAATKSILQKVDDSLRAETRAFFHKLVVQNVKKYEQLQEKFAKEREQFKHDLLRELQQKYDSSITYHDLIDNTTGVLYPSSHSPAGRAPSPNHVFTAEDLEREEERLQIDYYSHWHEYEMLHLQEAFRLQSAKIDNDWLQHEVQLKSEYDSKKAPFLPKSATMSDPAQSAENSFAATTPQPNRWHNAEKQKTLIHTAPVFSPSTHQLSRPSSAMRRGSKSSKESAMANTLELDRLDREYQETLGTLLRQKADAKRWLLRQQIRLNAQCDEVKREKAFIGQMMSEEAKDTQMLLAKIQQLLKKTSAHTTTQPVNVSSDLILSSVSGSRPSSSQYPRDHVTASLEHQNSGSLSQYPRVGNRSRTYTT
eukprot:CAMPEP_0173139554 /NCGR_PEP_ID=MMETSP1105-20130129/4328_1 /TAXON_ID=2985 /ORGANISM="Ochromonas sp., Strain BG-1" /LENGTH=435 /DNA_ID=CAMNT_0014052309 /DNA_START=207 /DNA_END=1514 /DNA_ORIENTATION=+